VKLDDIRRDLQEEPPACRFVTNGKACNAPGVMRTIDGLQIALCAEHYRLRRRLNTILARPAANFGPCAYCGDPNGVEYRLEGAPEELGGQLEYMKLCAKCVAERVPITVSVKVKKPTEKECPICDGTGQLHDSRDFYTCDSCNGTGVDP